jgi:hypothetical protein
VLAGLRAGKSFLIDEEPQGFSKEDWQARLCKLYEDRTSCEVSRAGLKKPTKAWVALQIIRENNLIELLPEVESLFADKPDHMNIEVFAGFRRQRLQRIFLKIPELVDLSARAGKQMSKVNVLGREHRNGFEYAGIVKSLGRLGTPEAVAHIKQALCDYHPTVRAAACEAIGYLDRAEIDLEISSLLDQRLVDERKYVSNAARSTLAVIGLGSSGNSPKTKLKNPGRGGEHRPSPQPRRFTYFRSKRRTSASFTPVNSTNFSAEIAAPSPVSSSVPFSFTLPRATCT